MWSESQNHISPKSVENLLSKFSDQANSNYHKKISICPIDLKSF